MLLEIKLVLVPTVGLERDDTVGPRRDVDAVGSVVVRLPEMHGELEGAASDCQLPPCPAAPAHADRAAETLDSPIRRCQAGSMIIEVPDDQGRGCEGGRQEPLDRASGSLATA